MDTLSSSIEEMSDEMNTIDEDIKTLHMEISNLDKSVADATEQRKKEHQASQDTVSMTEAAVQLVGKARARLAKFYAPSQNKAPEAAVFVQIHSSHAKSKVAPPELPDVPKLKATKGAGGVMGMMDEITHELEMDIQAAQHNEKTAQKEYVELMAEAQVGRAQDQKSLVDKNDSRATIEQKITEAKENKQQAYEELNNAHGYVSELHGSCDFILENFDLRRQARGNEVESLKNAKAVMESA